MLRVFILTAMLALSVALTSTMVLGEHAIPELPEGGIQWRYQTPCTDTASGKKGHCYIGVDRYDVVYVTFWVKGNLVHIRRIDNGKATTIWERHEGEPA
jgi:hypothetical protein